MKRNIEALRAEQKNYNNNEIKKITLDRLRAMEENIALASDLKLEENVHYYVVDKEDNILEEETATLQAIAALNTQREALLNKLMAA